VARGPGPPINVQVACPISATTDPRQSSKGTTGLTIILESFSYLIIFVMDKVYSPLRIKYLNFREIMPLVATTDFYKISQNDFRNIK
jgi:hypothetical protein